MLVLIGAILHEYCSLSLSAGRSISVLANSGERMIVIMMVVMIMSCMIMMS